MDVDRAGRFGSSWSGPRSVVFVVNVDRAFLSHRASWAAAYAGAGARVTVLAQDTGYARAIRELGFGFVALPGTREVSGVTAQIAAAAQILRHLLKIRPQLVVLSATAAYVLGWPAAAFLPSTRFVRVVAGAGRAMSEPRSVAGKVLRLQIRVGGWLRNVWTLFQIEPDLELFCRSGLATRSRSRLIRGTGIDVEVWQPTGITQTTPVRVVFASRLFREKGVDTFVEIARRAGSSDAEFLMYGGLDSGVTSNVSMEEVVGWESEGLLMYRGESSDMRSVLADTDILVFPTRHPEGTPRILIEAAAMGVPVIAADQAGCRAVLGDAGVLVAADDVEGFVSAVELLVGDPTERARLGSLGRARIVDGFSLEHVLEELFRMTRCVPTDR
nr:glycosyltransferase [Cellulomonas sp. Leaf334]